MTALPEPSRLLPAMADPVTAIMMTILRKRWRESVTMSCALLPWLALVAVFTGDGWLAAALSAPVMVVFGIAYRWMGWFPGALRSLQVRGWRPVGAKVERVGRLSSTLWVEDHALRVTWLSAAHAAVVERTGRVWMVDEGARATVRVDGSRKLLPAKRVRRSAKVRRAEPADVVELTARWLRQRSLLTLLYLPVLAGCLLSVFWLRSTLVGAAAGTLVAFVQLRHQRVDRQLPALVAGATWTAAEFTLLPWTYRRDGSASASGDLRLPDGRTVRVSMVNASPELLGAAGETGTLWFARPPEPGKTVAVGFPDYPLLAVATVS